LALPVSAIAGLQVLCRSVLAGEPTTVLAREEARPTAIARMPAGRRYTALVPTQLRRFLDAAPAALRAFDAVLVGGAATDPALLTRALEGGVAVVTGTAAVATAPAIKTLAASVIRIASGFVAKRRLIRSSSPMPLPSGVARRCFGAAAVTSIEA
jgi:hypothetical protein